MEALWSVPRDNSFDMKLSLNDMNGNSDLALKMIFNDQWLNEFFKLSVLCVGQCAGWT
jgi:hypothetical protein